MVYAALGIEPGTEFRDLQDRRYGSMPGAAMETLYTGRES